VSFAMNPAQHFGAEEVDLGNINFTSDLLAYVPAEVARRCRVLPLCSLPATLVLAVADPSDLESMDLAQRLLQRELEWYVADAKQLDEYINRLYGFEAGR
jgi:hypothetical protein